MTDIKDQALKRIASNLEGIDTTGMTVAETHIADILVDLLYLVKEEIPYGLGLKDHYYVYKVIE
jgi:hypothetical protein